jgi:hypothetical protein
VSFASLYALKVPAGASSAADHLEQHISNKLSRASGHAHLLSAQSRKAAEEIVDGDMAVVDHASLLRTGIGGKKNDTQPFQRPPNSGGQTRNIPKAASLF